MIDRTRIIESFFQVKETSKYSWHGVPTCNSDKKKRAKRKIELSPSDILIPSTNNKYWNRINKKGAVNIEIPDDQLVKVDKPILFDNFCYKYGY